MDHHKCQPNGFRCTHKCSLCTLINSGLNWCPCLSPGREDFRESGGRVRRAGYCALPCPSCDVSVSTTGKVDGPAPVVNVAVSVGCEKPMSASAGVVEETPSSPEPKKGYETVRNPRSPEIPVRKMFQNLRPVPCWISAS